MRVPPLSLTILVLAIAILFPLINRSAYRSFFAEDDLDNLANAHDTRAIDIVTTMTQPRVTGGDQFRGTTYAFYWAMFKAAGLRYAPYAAAPAPRYSAPKALASR